MARTLINLPKSIRRGDTVEIQTLIAHPMETGYRPGSDGVVLARDLIRRFSCFFSDASGQNLVFRLNCSRQFRPTPTSRFIYEPQATVR